MRKDFIRLIALSFIFLSSPSFAYQSQLSQMLNHAFETTQPVVMLSGGLGMMPVHGEHENFIIAPTAYAVISQHPTRTFNMVGAYLGTMFSFNPRLNMQVGFNYLYFANVSQPGILSQSADPNTSETFSFKYMIDNHQYLLDAKLLINADYYYQPYAYAGIGLNASRSHHFHVDAPLSTITPSFKSDTTNSLSYAVGLGIDYILNQDWRFGIGYRLSYLGKSQLNDGYVNGVPLGGTLKQSNLYAHEFLGQLSYLI